MSRPRKRPHCCGLFANRGRCSFSAGARRASPPVSALTRLETRVRLADHEDLATAADHLAVAVAGLRRLQGGQDLHDNLGNENGWRDNEAEHSACIFPPIQPVAQSVVTGGLHFPQYPRRFDVPGHPHGRRADPHDRWPVGLWQGNDQPSGRLAAGLALPRFRRPVPVRRPCGRLGGHRSFGRIGAGALRLRHHHRLHRRRARGAAHPRERCRRHR